MKKPTTLKNCFPYNGLLIIFFVFVYSSALSQKITLNAKNQTLKEVFSQIEKQTDMSINFDESVIDASKKVSIDLKDKSINEALTTILSNTGYTYSVKENHIIITQQVVQSSAPKSKINGVLKNKPGETLVGVGVVIKGTNIGTVTDLDGNFAIDASTGSVLILSGLGYKTTEVTVSGDAIDVIMEEDTQLLDEIVVVGYGSVKKSDLTGAVSNISASESNKGGSSTSVGQMIQGRIAGLTVQQNSSQPGGGSSVIIRGRNSIYGSVAPLYIVDGFPFDAAEAPTSGENFSNTARDPLNFINPNDIETVSVLKDAAATAIYGTRGANGVIIITTKKGKEGNLKIGYDGYAGIQSQAKKYEMLNGPEYMTYWNRFQEGPKFTADEISKASTTDWMDEITRTGTIQSHQINLSAAEKYLRYYFSAGYYDQKGIIKNADMGRLSARSNIDYKRDKLSIFTNASFTNISDRNQSDVGGTRNSIIKSALSFAPNVKKPEGGSYVMDAGSDFNIYPLSVLGISDKTKNDKIDFNVNLTYEILPGLKPQVKVGYNVQNSLRKYFMPSTTPFNGGAPNTMGRFHKGRASVTSTRNSGVTAEGLLNYTKTFNELKVIALAGYSYQLQGWEGNRTLGQDFSPVDVFGPDNMGAADKQYTQTWKGDNVIISGFGRLDLTWKEKYFLTGTLRRDGASKFGANNKWGWFPGVSAAWKIDKESFFDSENIDLLKIRAGWGKTGNSGFDNYLSQPFYEVLKDNGAVIGQGIHTVTQLSKTLANPDLKWETTGQLNIGIDLSVFQKFNFTLDLYRKKTSDLIIPMPMLSESGRELKWVNAADFVVNGIEFGFDGKMLTTNDFRWSTNFTLGWNNNKVSKINVQGTAAKSSLESIGIIEGEKPRSYFMYKFKEINKDGALTFYDLNNDGEVDVKDRMVIGNPDPDVTIGLGNTLNYKNVELTFFFSSALGQKMHNLTKADHSAAYLAHPRNMLKSILTEGNLPTTTVAVGGDYTNNSRWVENASYLRLQNITLAYNFPSKLFANKIQNLRLYIQGQNLFTTTQYSGVDPESNTLYPSVRTFTGGISLTF